MCRGVSTVRLVTLGRVPAGRHFIASSLSFLTSFDLLLWHLADSERSGSSATGQQAVPSNSHPCLSYYGSSTLAASFPLLMFVGREPNCSQPVSSAVGPYNFAAKLHGPKTAFWNLSYGFAATFATPASTGAALKQRCIAADASPIIYADAVPVGLAAGAAAAQRAAHRAAINGAQAQAHVQAVFSHASLISRVRLVVLSGLEGAYRPAAVEYLNECKRRNMAAIEIRFLFGNNMPTIREQFASNPVAANLMAKTMAAFP